VNRLSRLRGLILVLVTGGLLSLLALGSLVRSCTDRLRVANQEPSDRSPSENPVARPSGTAARPLPLAGANPDPGLRAPKLERALIEQADRAPPVQVAPAPPPVDAGKRGGSPGLTEEEIREVELRRSLADKEKQKLLQLRRP
jgi:hypothetical protein